MRSCKKTSQGKEQQTIPVNTGEGMERSKGKPTATAMALKIRRKDRRKLMKSPAGSTMESIPGENVHSIEEETITVETTKEAIKEAQAPVDHFNDPQQVAEAM